MKDSRDTLRYARLALAFARRAVRARYKQTAFGVAWAVIQPLSLMVVFNLVFARIARVPSEGVPYPLFAYSALVFWTYFATTLSQGTVAIAAHANLVRKIYFPREVLLVSVLLSAGFDLLIALAALAGLFAYYQAALAWTALWIVPLLALQALFTLALLCVTSSLHVYYRDIAHALPLALQLWMFATPVAYPLSLVPERLLPLYLLNPMAPLMDSYRRVLLGHQPPDPGAVGLAFVGASLLLLGGYLLFKRAERSFADVV